ncbi:hypothetical protein P4053_19995 [Pseudomonas aeruginosa]|nr:hypothetical protein [Pseudomonas aeruginosa]
MGPILDRRLATFDSIWLFSGSGFVRSVLAAFYLVWLLNLYNFMDGIDGIASVEAISVCLGGALLFLFVGEFKVAQVTLVLAAAVMGFLFWNFPSARIFMGDAEVVSLVSF